MSKKFLETLASRDLIAQKTFENAPEINGLYCGFDVTADSLHVGQLTVLSVFKIAQEHGIPVFALLGQATTAIGDPSEKAQTRKKMNQEAIKTNVVAIKKQLKHLLPNLIFVNNLDWIKKLNTVNFLELAAYMPVSYILKFKTFADRLENNAPFNLQEMLYPMIQGYDFLHLFENNNCNLEIGGQDQWTNIISGVELIKRKHGKDSHGLTFPLLTKSNGEKMGKTVSGAVWLSKEKISAYDFWQFWRSTEDSMVLTYIKRLTSINHLNLPENINECKIMLANELTTWVFGSAQAKKAEKTAKEIFENSNFENAKIVELNTNNLTEAIAQIEKISKTQAKTLINQNAIKINKTAVKDFNFQVQTNDVLQIGKNKVYKLKISV